MSIIGSVINGLGYSLGPVSSLLVNKFGGRAVCIVGGLFSIAGPALSTVAPNIAVMFSMYGVLTGIGIGLMFVPTVISCNYYFDKKRALANGEQPAKSNNYVSAEKSKYYILCTIHDLFYGNYTVHTPFQVCHLVVDRLVDLYWFLLRITL